MARYCLIGGSLSHTLSPTIHQYLGLNYVAKEIANEAELQKFVKEGEYDGFNVTIPYKQRIMQYLDVIDDDALRIGAVNTVVKKDGKLYGYNTDIDGLEYDLTRIGMDINHKNVMILGSGGTSKTVAELCRRCHATYVIISRDGVNNYKNCYNFMNIDTVINTTPVGMFPNCDDEPLDIGQIYGVKNVYDVIYNPTITQLCKKAKEIGLRQSNGLGMLIAQAVCAEEKFGIKIDKDKDISRCYNYINNIKKSIFLIGMPGCGKSTIGEGLAKKLNKKFYDTDKEIERSCKMPISQIFAENGEEFFRTLESDYIKSLSDLNSVIVATGGGVVEKEINRKNLKKESIVVWIKRKLEDLDMKSRPLSVNLNAVRIIESRRLPIYGDLSDIIIENDGTSDGAVEKLIQELREKYEYLCD